MEYREKINLINNLCSGYTMVAVGGTRYMIDVPTELIKQEAELYYIKEYEKNRFKDWLPESKKHTYLIKAGLWSTSSPKHIEDFNTGIENKKLEIYHAVVQYSNIVDKLRRELRELEKKVWRLKRIKHLLDDYTVSGFAEHARERYLFHKIALNENYKPVWKTINSVDDILLKCMIGAYLRSQYTDAQYREIARTDPWKSYWSVGGTNNFRVVGDNQRNLVLYTKMYESASQHPEYPPDKVVNDDDAFDGWLIFINRKAEKEKTSQSVNSRINQKHQGAGEIFIPVNSVEQAREVESLNNTQSRIIKKKMMRQVELKGHAGDLDVEENVLEVIQKKGRRNG
jgi:hypothetical protein